MTIQDFMNLENSREAQNNTVLTEWVFQIVSSLAGQQLDIQPAQSGSALMPGPLYFFVSQPKSGPAMFVFTWTIYQQWKEQSNQTIKQSADQLMASLREYNAPPGD